jgi:uncharacterized protein YbjT (DUF2867 family)
MKTVSLIGGSGFIGRRVVSKLVKKGYGVRIATRKREHAQHLILLPVDVLEVDVHNPAALARFLTHTDVVINLAGILHSRRHWRNPSCQSYTPEFAKIHVELPKKIIAACRAKQIQRLLHVSALGADPNGPSMYHRSRADGEAVVRSAVDLDATIFQPSVVFGPGDRFLTLFAHLQRFFQIIPLASAQTRFQPIYVDDVAQAIVQAIDLNAAIGATYALGGPRIYTLKELVRIAGRAIGKPRPILPLPLWMARLQALCFEWLPGTPLMTRDNLDSMQVDNILSVPMAPELNMMPVSLETIAPVYLAAGQGRFFRLSKNHNESAYKKEIDRRPRWQD